MSNVYRVLGISIASIAAPVIAVAFLAPNMLRFSDHAESQLGRFGYPSDGRGMDLSKRPELKNSFKGLKPDDRVLLVAMGSCSQCSANSYAPGDESKESYDRVLMLLDKRIQPTAPPTSDPERYQYVMLPDSKLFESLKAAVRPRLYRLSGDGKVLDAESTPDDRGSFLR